MKRKVGLLPLCLFFVTVIPSMAQVSIGSDKAPGSAALLQVKNLEASPTSITSDDNITVDSQGGGLGLPRVMLENKKTLQPFLSLSESNANAGKIKEINAGLMVYNIKVTTDPSVVDDDLIFQQGIYIWSGSRWELAGSGNNAEGLGENYFFMPAFNLPMNGITPSGTADAAKPKFNLYDVYKNQYNMSLNTSFARSSTSRNFVFSPDSNRLYTAAEIDFVVTYYDDTVIRINSIDTNGIMTYEVLNDDPEPISFINIVFVPK